MKSVSSSQAYKALLREAAMLTELHSKAFHCPHGVTVHISVADGFGRWKQADSSATEPWSSRQLTYLIRVPFPHVAEH